MILKYNTVICVWYFGKNRQGFTMAPKKPRLFLTPANPSLFANAKSVQSVNHDINTRDLTSRYACLEVKFGFNKE
jgi:hypothetical protein